MNLNLKKVYISGPDVFYKNAKEIGEKRKKLCHQYRYIGLFPSDNEVPQTKTIFDKDLQLLEVALTGKEKSTLIYEANIRMMEQADFGIFNLSPFRGPSADVGTVFELGYMKALRKPVFSFSSAEIDKTYFERVNEFYKTENSKYDPKDMLIEDFGNDDNLMISVSEGWIFDLDIGIDTEFDVEVDDTEEQILEKGFISCLESARRFYKLKNSFENV